MAEEALKDKLVGITHAQLLAAVNNGTGLTQSQSDLLEQLAGTESDASQIDAAVAIAEQLGEMTATGEELDSLLLSSLRIHHADGTIESLAASTDVARGNLLLAAFADHTAGDTYYLGPFVFDLGTQNIVLPGDCVLWGSGKTKTVIKSSFVSSANSETFGNVFQFSDGTEVHSMELRHAVLAPAQFQFSSGLDGSSFVLYDCLLTGDTDWFKLDETTLPLAITLYNCEFSTHYDTVVNYSTQITAYNCVFQVRRSSSGYDSTLVCAFRTMGDNSNPPCRLYNCKFIAWTDRATGTLETYAITSGDSQRIELHQCSLSVTAPSGTKADVFATTNGAVAVHGVTGSGAGGTLLFSLGVGVTTPLAGENVVANVPTYTDNAAAAAGGLTPGQTYRTSTGALMVVYTA